jgi:hypothetical protein
MKQQMAWRQQSFEYQILGLEFGMSCRDHTKQVLIQNHLCSKDLLGIWQRQQH